MGEIADMMLDGTMCEGCGVFLDGGTPGYVRYCPGCELYNEITDHTNARARDLPPPAGSASAKVICPDCGRRVKAKGLQDHYRDVHGS